MTMRTHHRRGGNELLPFDIYIVAYFIDFVNDFGLDFSVLYTCTILLSGFVHIE